MIVSGGKFNWPVKARKSRFSHEVRTPVSGVVIHWFYPPAFMIGRKDNRLRESGEVITSNIDTFVIKHFPVITRFVP